jgi:hypothetical protein
MKAKQIGIFVILAIGVAGAIFGTAASSLASPAFASGDEKKCKDNGDNNCNDKHKTQKIDVKNECKIENYNKDHSSHNDNANELVCVNEAQNLKDVVQIFGAIEEPEEPEDSEQPVTVTEEPVE